MAGRLTRQEARERLDQVYGQLKDRLVPLDENQPVKDGNFWEWEELADEFDRDMTGALMEVLSGLSSKATLEEPGVCPHCGKGDARWLEEEGQRERQSNHGNVVISRQVARCRSCGRSFSPSGTGLGSGRGDRLDAQGRGQGVPGSSADAL
jgi:hypothetical protein